MTEDPLTEHPEQGPALGAPPKYYTRGVHEAIVDHIRRGNRPVVAAGLAGITSATFYGWMQRGREADPHLESFANDVELAMATAEGKAVEKIFGDTGFADPDNAKYWLERARPEGWSKETNAKVNALLVEFMERLERTLPPDVFRMVIAAASGQTAVVARPTFQLSGSEEETEG